MNNKQSSIEWLNDELASLNFDYLTGLIDNKEYNERHKVIMEQAKTMHKEEVTEAFYVGSYEYNNFDSNSTEYYNETFGGNNEQQQTK